MFKHLFSGLVKAIGRLFFGDDGKHGLFGPILALIGSLVSTAVAALSGVFQNLIMWILDLLMSVFALFFNALGLGDLNPVTHWQDFANTPFGGRALSAAEDLGIFTAFAILALAYGIRFILKLVPFI